MRHEQHRRGEGTHHGGEGCPAAHLPGLGAGDHAAGARNEPAGERHDACATPLHLAGSRPERPLRRAMATPPPVVDIVTAGDASRAARSTDAAHLLVSASFGTASTATSAAAGELVRRRRCDA